MHSVLQFRSSHPGYMNSNLLTGPDFLHSYNDKHLGDKLKEKTTLSVLVAEKQWKMGIKIILKAFNSDQIST